MVSGSANIYLFCVFVYTMCTHSLFSIRPVPSVWSLICTLVFLPFWYISAFCIEFIVGDRKNDGRFMCVCVCRTCHGCLVFRVGNQCIGHHLIHLQSEQTNILTKTKRRKNEFGKHYNVWAGAKFSVSIVTVTHHLNYDTRLSIPVTFYTSGRTRCCEA